MLENEYTVELIDNENENEDGCEVTICYKVDVVPTEYEGPYVFYQGGAVCEEFTVDPFEFRGVKYKEMTEELLPFLVINSRFKYGVEDLQEFGEYCMWLFEEYVAPNIKTEVRYYPDSRYS